MPQSTAEHRPTMAELQDHLSRSNSVRSRCVDDSALLHARTWDEVTEIVGHDDHHGGPDSSREISSIGSPIVRQGSMSSNEPHDNDNSSLADETNAMASEALPVDSHVVGHANTLLRHVSTKGQHGPTAHHTHKLRTFIEKVMHQEIGAFMINNNNKKYKDYWKQGQEVSVQEAFHSMEESDGMLPSHFLVARRLDNLMWREWYRIWKENQVVRAANSSGHLQSLMAPYLNVNSGGGNMNITMGEGGVAKAIPGNVLAGEERSLPMGRLSLPTGDLTIQPGDPQGNTAVRQSSLLVSSSTRQPSEVINTFMPMVSTRMNGPRTIIRKAQHSGLSMRKTKTTSNLQYVYDMACSGVLNQVEDDGAEAMRMHYRAPGSGGMIRRDRSPSPDHETFNPRLRHVVDAEKASSVDLTTLAKENLEVGGKASSKLAPLEQGSTQESPKPRQKVLFGASSSDESSGSGSESADSESEDIETITMRRRQEKQEGTPQKADTKSKPQRQRMAAFGAGSDTDSDGDSDDGGGIAMLRGASPKRAINATTGKRLMGDAPKGRSMRITAPPAYGDQGRQVTPEKQLLGMRKSEGVTKLGKLTSSEIAEANEKNAEQGLSKATTDEEQEMLEKRMAALLADPDDAVLFELASSSPQRMLQIQLAIAECIDEVGLDPFNVDIQSIREAQEEASKMENEGQPTGQIEGVQKALNLLKSMDDATFRKLIKLYTDWWKSAKVTSHCDNFDSLLMDMKRHVPEAILNEKGHFRDATGFIVWDKDNVRHMLQPGRRHYRVNNVYADDMTIMGAYVDDRLQPGLCYLVWMNSTNKDGTETRTPLNGGQPVCYVTHEQCPFFGLDPSNAINVCDVPPTPAPMLYESEENVFEATNADDAKQSGEKKTNGGTASTAANGAAAIDASSNRGIKAPTAANSMRAIPLGMVRAAKPSPVKLPAAFVDAAQPSSTVFECTADRSRFSQLTAAGTLNVAGGEDFMTREGTAYIFRPSLRLQGQQFVCLADDDRVADVTINSVSLEQRLVEFKRLPEGGILDLDGGLEMVQKEPCIIMKIRISGICTVTFQDEKAVRENLRKETVDQQPFKAVCVIQRKKAPAMPELVCMVETKLEDLEDCFNSKAFTMLSKKLYDEQVA
eukprot:Clim_evm24s214 gene=Clim_evmTU24s214